MRLPLFLFLIIISLSQALLAESLTGKVVGVSDGDTITLLVENGQQKITHKIRLAQIDTPESSQPWGQKAKQALAGMVFSQTVRADVETTDKYNRKVANIFIDNLWVNAKLVEQGHAWVYRQYSHSQQLILLENQAKSAQLGLWGLSETKRMPPWEWRQLKKQNKLTPDQYEDKANGTVVRQDGQISQLNQMTREQSPRDTVNRPTSTPSNSSSCGNKSKCSEMSSCEEAKFYLTQCGLRKLDRNNDGVPCESMCK